MLRKTGTLPLCITIILLCSHICSAQLTDKDVLAFTPAAKQMVSLYWKDDAGKILGSLARLKQYTALKREKLYLP